MLNVHVFKPTEAGRSLTHAYVVDAGLEPDQFTHLFPYWIVQEDITEIQIEVRALTLFRLHLPCFM